MVFLELACTCAKLAREASIGDQRSIPDARFSIVYESMKCLNISLRYSELHSGWVCRSHRAQEFGKSHAACIDKKVLMRRTSLDWEEKRKQFSESPRGLRSKYRHWYLFGLELVEARLQSCSEGCIRKFAYNWASLGCRERWVSLCVPRTGSASLCKD